jgi:hypothetical protein
LKRCGRFAATEGRRRSCCKKVKGRTRKAKEGVSLNPKR